MKSSKSRSLAGLALSLAALSMFVPQHLRPAPTRMEVAQWHHSGIVVTLRVKPTVPNTTVK
jgi:hypothetical protein